MAGSMTLPGSRRPLTDAERRLVRSKARDLATRGSRASRGALLATCGGTLLLWLWTLMASDAHWTVVTAFWLVAGGVLAVWIARTTRRDTASFRSTADALESALRADVADVHEIHATRFAAVDEIEDEGSCYAFELPDQRLVFVTGQEFYESARFPCLDFSLVYILDERGRPVDMVIEKRSPKAVPSRAVSAAIKRALAVPEHLEVRSGRLEDIETLLAGGPSRER